jgi:hypothetical protein
MYFLGCWNWYLPGFVCFVLHLPTAWMFTVPTLIDDGWLLAMKSYLFSQILRQKKCHYHYHLTTINAVIAPSLL